MTNILDDGEWQKNFERLQKPIVSALQKHKVLEKRLRTNCVVPPNTHSALFAHLAGIKTQSENISRILFRLAKDFARSSAAWALVHSSDQDKQPGIGETIQRQVEPSIFLEAINQQNWLVLDLDCLYVFSGILLDQWAMFISYLSGIKKPEESTFNNLARVISSKNKLDDPLNFVLSHFRQDITWISVHLTLIRTEMVIHPKKPLARIFTGRHGDDYSVGLMSFESFSDKDIATIKELATKHVGPKEEVEEEGENEAWEITTVLHRLVDLIGEMDERGDRERTIDLALRHGYQGTDYSQFSKRVFELISSSFDMLDDQFDSYSAKVNVGIKKR